MALEPSHSGMALDPAVAARLCTISCATITTVLFKKGLRNIWLRGSRCLAQGQPRTAGRAFTMRFVPAREDLSGPAAWSSPRSTRVAVEDMPAGRQVKDGAPLPGLYPPSAESLARYERQRQAGAAFTGATAPAFRT